ncbi:sigma-70 family RNA polymerase sigma factor [uncultured Aquimarina sp.]|uniref:RNA polymerase sigma factor n=1 Tax=uncultured Aquimarina sp. TaxID=575652 RepID=UPI0026260F3D|nr:sigma-70 family RNA polymerase sigma factor [uncultured Aquimarina sp.]
MKTINQTEIIHGIISGDETVLKSFYSKNLPYLKNHILKQGGSIEDTEDIFQDALLILYSKLRSNKTSINTSVHGYFYGICKKLWLNHARKERKWIMADILTDEHQDNELIITEQLFQKDRRNLFNTYFTALQNTTKQLWLHFFEEKSHQEIAIITGYSESYIRKQKCETKKKMIQNISQDPLYRELADI